MNSDFYDDGDSCPNDSLDFDVDDSSDFDTKIEQDIEESLYPDQLNADQLALAMGFGEFTANGKEVYSVDENTDKENWEKAMKLYPLHEQPGFDDNRSLSAFEQYVNSIISGQRKGPWQR